MSSFICFAIAVTSKQSPIEPNCTSNTFTCLIILNNCSFNNKSINYSNAKSASFDDSINYGTTEGAFFDNDSINYGNVDYADFYYSINYGKINNIGSFSSDSQNSGTVLSSGVFTMNAINSSIVNGGCLFTHTSENKSSGIVNGNTQFYEDSKNI